MDITEGCTSLPVEGPEEYFTGDARLDPLSGSQSEARAAAASVVSEPGTRTAWQAPGVIDVDAGDRILIHAAAGGVNHFVVQFAQGRDLYVIGTVSRSDEEYFRELSVDGFVNYCEQRFEEVPEPIDGVTDDIGGETFDRSLETLNGGGTIDKPPSPPTDEQQGPMDGQDVEAIITTVRWNGEWLGDITELPIDGTVLVMLDTVLPLSEATGAHRLSGAKYTRGKIILAPGDNESAPN